MRIGVPVETHPGERRVATTPDVASQLIKLGFSVAVEQGAGAKASYSDDAYAAAGCDIVASRKDLWRNADLILKVRAPDAKESKLLRSDQTLLSFVWAGQNPDLLKQLTATGATVMALDNQLRLQPIEGGTQEPSLIVSSPWSHLAAARANGQVAIAGYVALDGDWRVKTWAPGELSGTRSQNVPMDGTGPICSVAVADGGQIAIGGYGPGVGVQVWLGASASPIRLDGGEKDARLYYHRVAISPDARYVYAVSRHIPHPQSKNHEYTILRAWSTSLTTPLDELQKVVAKERVDSPVQAAAFLPSRGLLLLSASQTLELWQF